MHKCYAIIVQSNTTLNKHVFEKLVLLNKSGQGQNEAFECKINILCRMKGTWGSEKRAGLATAAADLDHYDVSLSQGDDKSSDIRHDRQRTVSEREMAKHDT